MATVTLTERYSDLDDWPGRLLEVNGAVTVLAATATSFVFRYEDGDFAGFTVEVAGTGLAYLDGVPVDGTMDTVTIRDADDDAVVTFEDLAASGEIASSFAVFYQNVFGSPFDEAGPGGDGKTAWSHLLSGDDLFLGTSGDDDEWIHGTNTGDDVFQMGDGNDALTGGIGDDDYQGGAGFDRLTYATTTWNEGQPATRGVVVNAKKGFALDPWGGRDTISGIESYEGSRFDDRLIGDGAENTFRGGAGADVLSGGKATFDRDGNLIEDRDTAKYGNDYWSGGQFGIVVNLETSFNGRAITGTIRDGFGRTDVVKNIEDVDGTRFDDVFIGSRVRNQFEGGEGTDYYDGGADDGDQIWFDNWFYEDDIGGIVVDLSLESGQIIDDGFGNTETAINIESIAGTRKDDVIAGDDHENGLQGLEGDDVLTGNGGRDTFVYYETRDMVGTDTITDFTQGGPDADVLLFRASAFEGMSASLLLENDLEASTDDGTFLFDGTTSTLYWDPDGNDADAPIAVAVLVGVTALTASDILIV